MRILLLTFFLYISVLLLAGCAGSPEKESFGEYMDGSVVTTKVKTKLFDDPVTSGFDISVETYKGVVQLSGFVSSVKEKQRAEEIARSVEGVRAVKNNITLKPRN